jgi:hypothetical protein
MVTPGAERAGFVLDAGNPRQFGRQKVRNEVANLPEQVQFRGRWNGRVFIFHPCRMAAPNQSFQLFSKS